MNDRTGTGSSERKENQNLEPNGNNGFHYLVGGGAFALVLFALYISVFEKTPPPFLLEREMEEPKRIQVGSDRPRIVIEDVDFSGKALSQQNEDKEDYSVSNIDLPLSETDPHSEDVSAVQQTNNDRAESVITDPDGSSPADSQIPPHDGAFIVQVIATRDNLNAKRISDEIEAQGLKAYVEPLTREDLTLHRVRVGPFIDRGEAEIAKHDLGLLGYGDAVIIDLR